MEKQSWNIKDGLELDVSGFKVMGILNVTPDSFYDGKRHEDFDMALLRARRMKEEGADIIDVGGESTRPGSPRIPVKEEINRVVPLIKALTAEISIPISCDTYKAEVGARAIEAGASIINDISAFSLDAELFEVVRDSGCGYVLMHMQGTPGDMQKNPFYNDVTAEILGFFSEKLAWMKEKGLDPQRIVIDPGIGFGKRVEDNLALIKNLDRFQSPGRPLLIGASRKSFIGKLLNGLPAEERLEGSLVSAVIAYIKGARIFRVHDVAETRRALQVAEAFYGDSNTGKEGLQEKT